MSGQTVTIRRVLPASREDVFDAWLDPEGMRQWMCPGPVTAAEVTLDARVGGQFRIVMNAPGAQFVNTGEYRRLDRPSTLQFTWISTHMDNEETLVTVELHERGAQCELVLTHERVPQEHSALELMSGWTQIADKLAASVTPRPRPVPAGYALLFRRGPRALTEAEQRRGLEANRAWGAGLLAEGRGFDVRQLGPERETIAADGAPSEWPLVALVFVEASSYEEALEVARTHPGVEYGMSIEVRPWWPPQR